MHNTNHQDHDPRCICGALLDVDSPTLCRKCTARARWRRRRTGGRRRAEPGGDLG